MNIKDIDKLNNTLSEIDFTSKKTFIMGRVNSGKRPFSDEVQQ